MKIVESLEGNNTNKWIICRVCLKTSENEMLQLFNDDTLIEQIDDCAGVHLEYSNVLPDKICTKCQLLLKLATKFRVLVQQSQQQLAQLLNQTTVKERKCEEFELPKENNTEEVLVKSENSQDNDSISYEVEEVYEMDDYETECINFPTENTSYFTEGTEDSIEIDAVQSENTDDEYVINDLPDKKIKLETKSTVKQRKSLHGAQTTTTKTRKPKVKREKLEKGKTTGDSKNKDSYVCNLCGNIYTEKSKLNLHMKIHSDFKPHECEICHKRFRQTPQLARHMNSHTGNRPFKCNYCQSSFADPSTCIKHQRIHTNERPYKCDKCPKAFAYSNVLKVHLKTHTGEKPYECQICLRRFAQLHHKNAHERSHDIATTFTDEE